MMAFPTNEWTDAFPGKKKKDPIPISGISISDRCLGPNADVFAGFAGGSGGAAV
jgi:hypothetical protein